MPDDMLTADNVSKELLKSVFDAAYMDTGLDSDGDLYVRDNCRVFVFPDKEKRLIKLRTYFGFTDRSTELQRFRCVNEINSNYLIVRAVAMDKTLAFEYDVSLEGGVYMRALVQLVKRFASIPRSAVEDYGRDIVE